MRYRRLSCRLTLALLLSGASAAAHANNLILPDRPDAGLGITLTHGSMDADPSNHLQVYVGKSAMCCANKLPMAGRYTTNDRTIIFKPAFNFNDRQTYTAVTKSGNTGHDSEARTLHEFRLESANRAAAPEVIEIYPSGDKIPENTLRFYIHFSTPMKPHVSADYIKLVNNDGVEDSAAFMAFKQELWSEDRKRLTVLMDPGRIKRGVAQNRISGPALIEGNHYSIVVQHGWPSAAGNGVAPAFEKRFLATRALRALPDTDLWSLNVPRMSTREPLEINLDRAFDIALLENAVTVLNSIGEVIPGTVAIMNTERTWQFKPRTPWTASTVRVAVASLLEDVAGNNFLELLDHSVDSAVNATVSQLEQRVIHISLKPASG